MIFEVIVIVVVSSDNAMYAIENDENERWSDDEEQRCDEKSTK